MNTTIQNRIQEANSFLNQLLNSDKIRFKELKPSMLKEVGGVYLIGRNNTEEIIYIGRTVNLRRRLYTNHLMGNITTAKVKKYLIEDSDFPNIQTAQDAKRFLQEECYLQYIEVNDWKLRGFLEGYFLHPLNVKYIEREH